MRDDLSVLPGQWRSPPSRARLTICQEGLGMRKRIRPSKTALRGEKTNEKINENLQPPPKPPDKGQSHQIWRECGGIFDRGAISEPSGGKIAKPARRDRNRLELRPLDLRQNSPDGSWHVRDRGSCEPVVKSLNARGVAGTPVPRGRLVEVKPYIITKNEFSQKTQT